MQPMTAILRRLAAIAAAMTTILLLTGSESQAGIGTQQKQALNDSTIVHADGTLDHLSGDGDDDRTGSNGDNDGDDNRTGSNGDNDGDDDRTGGNGDNDGDD